MEELYSLFSFADSVWVDEPRKFTIFGGLVEFQDLEGTIFVTKGKSSYYDLDLARITKSVDSKYRLKLEFTLQEVKNDRWAFLSFICSGTKHLEYIFKLLKRTREK